MTLVCRGSLDKGVIHNARKSDDDRPDRYTGSGDPDELKCRPVGVDPAKGKPDCGSSHRGQGRDDIGGVGRWSLRLVAWLPGNALIRQWGTPSGTHPPERLPASALARSQLSTKRRSRNGSDRTKALRARRTDP